jgi:hypothetical protein
MTTWRLRLRHLACGLVQESEPRVGIVAYLPKGQTVGRRRSRTQSPITSSEQFGHPARFPFASPDINERAHERPDHPGQEAVADYPILDQPSAAKPTGLPPRLDLVQLARE